MPALVNAEQSALRRILPRRNRWPELAIFDEPTDEMEAHIVELGDRCRAVHARLFTADRDDADRYATWLLHRNGDEPEPEKPGLEEERDEAERALAGAQAALGRLLEERAQFVQKHRKRLVRDAESATAELRARYEQALRAAENARREVIEWRETTIWSRLYPDCHESDLQLRKAIAGAERARLAPTGLTISLDADKLFAALREHAEWIEQAIPQTQLARERLTGEKRTTAVLNADPARRTTPAQEPFMSLGAQVAKAGQSFSSGQRGQAPRPRQPGPYAPKLRGRPRPWRPSF